MDLNNPPSRVQHQKVTGISSTKYKNVDFVALIHDSFWCCIFISGFFKSIPDTQQFNYYLNKYN